MWVAFPIFPFVLMHMNMILFARSLLLLVQLLSVPWSHCGLINDSIMDSVLLQVSVVKKAEC